MLYNRIPKSGGVLYNRIPKSGSASIMSWMSGQLNETARAQVPFETSFYGCDVVDAAHCQTSLARRD